MSPKRPVHSPDGTRMSSPMTISATPRPVRLPLSGRFSSGMGRHSHVLLKAFAVEKVIGIEGDDLTLRCHEMDAGALHRADAEIVAVEKLHDDNPEDLVVAEILRHL